jgi:hypothetical protein
VIHARHGPPSHGPPLGKTRQVRTAHVPIHRHPSAERISPRRRQAAATGLAVDAAGTRSYPTASGSAAEKQMLWPPTVDRRPRGTTPAPASARAVVVSSSSCIFRPVIGGAAGCSPLPTTASLTVVEDETAAVARPLTDLRSSETHAGLWSNAVILYITDEKRHCISAKDGGKSPVAVEADGLEPTPSKHCSPLSRSAHR